MQVSPPEPLDDNPVPLADGHEPIHGLRKGLRWLIEQVATADRSACWCYPFGDDKYGRLRWAGKDDRAHRIAWRLDRQRELPPDRNMVVMHECDNQRCCNPDHLRLGRQQENTRDAHDRGLATVRRGREVKCAKLTEDDVREIRSRTNDQPQKEMAEEFGVSQTTICHVRRRIVWAHVA